MCKIYMTTSTVTLYMFDNYKFFNWKKLIFVLKHSCCTKKLFSPLFLAVDSHFYCARKPCLSPEEY